MKKIVLQIVLYKKRTHGFIRLTSSLISCSKLSRKLLSITYDYECVMQKSGYIIIVKNSYKMR